jgi:hypothetical protein
MQSARTYEGPAAAPAEGTPAPVTDAAPDDRGSSTNDRGSITIDADELDRLIDERLRERGIVGPEGAVAPVPPAYRPSVSASMPAPESVDDAPAEPFAFGDFTWMNGANRQKQPPLLGMKYVTFSVLMDTNYTYSLNRPKDNTVVSSTVTGRHNEFNILMASFAADVAYKGVRATLALQAGTRTNLVQRNDSTSLRGQYGLTDALKYVREATAGYHFDVMHGLNIDGGIFMSYIGLASYLNFENWMYQPSYVSDNTPFYFKGIRAQLFPTDKVKVELWLINGWQSYAKYNDGYGVGFQVDYRPREWLALVSNGYTGYDTRGEPERLRVHSDNSVRIRYVDRGGDKAGFNRAAFSLTADIGCEHGGSVACKDQNFVAAMLYNRFWFARDKIGSTQGGGIINNPGRYLVLAPPGPVGFDFSPGTRFFAWDVSTTFDFMPNDYLTFRLEGVHRSANVPYFAGRGGVTSPDGYTDTAVPPDFQPDRARSETRFILATMVRF